MEWINDSTYVLVGFSEDRKMHDNTEYKLKCLAMSIVNFVNETTEVDYKIRQDTNDKCFDYVIEKIKEYMKENNT